MGVLKCLLLPKKTKCVKFYGLKLRERAIILSLSVLCALSRSHKREFFSNKQTIKRAQ